MDRIAEFCHRWKITELSLFGSVVRDDFGPDSDVDVLVALAPDARLGLFAFARMQSEFAVIVGRSVDMALKRAVLRKADDPTHRDILESARVLYAA